MKFYLIILLALALPAWSKAGCDSQFSCGRGRPLEASWANSGAHDLVRITVTSFKPRRAVPDAHIDLVVKDASSRIVARKAVRIPMTSPKRDSAGGPAFSFLAALPDLDGKNPATVAAVYHACPPGCCGI